MNSRPELNREVEEHIKLLRKAARGELLLLSLGVLVTLGLWVTLQAGDQKAPAVDERYDSTLADLKKKWGIPVEIPIGYESSFSEIVQGLKSENTDLNKDSVKQLRFFTELQDLKAKYSEDRGGAYRVQLRIPYLQDPVVINGLSLADVWPFGVALILATAAVLYMRERVNAIIVSWLSRNMEDPSAGSRLIILSDFKARSLSESRILKHRCMVYSGPVIISPEQLLTYALLAVIIYLSFEMSYFVALSHKMESTLTDYFALVWFFSVALAVLLWLTWRHYARTLHQFIGIRVRGRIADSIHRLVHSCNDAGGRLGARHRWLGKVTSLLNSLLPISALLCLFLPWMGTPELAVPGYRFLLSHAFPPLNSGLYAELRIQLVIAVLLIVLRLIGTYVTRQSSGPWGKFLSGVRLFVAGGGILVLVLAGNLAFHIGMLQTAANVKQLFFFGFAKVATGVGIVPAGPGPYQIWESPLFETDAGYGLWLFLLLYVLLVVSDVPLLKRYLNAET